MPALTVTKQVAAPLAQVFALATDIPRWPETIPAIKKVEVLTPGPMQLGTRFKETRVMFGREATETMEVTSFDAPRSYVLEARSCGSHYRTQLSFDVKDGGTQISMQFQATPQTFMGKLMAFMMKPMMRKLSQLCAKDLDAIAAAAESRR